MRTIPAGRCPCCRAACSARRSTPPSRPRTRRTGGTSARTAGACRRVCSSISTISRIRSMFHAHRTTATRHITLHVSLLFSSCMSGFCGSNRSDTWTSLTSPPMHHVPSKVRLCLGFFSRRVSDLGGCACHFQQSRSMYCISRTRIRIAGSCLLRRDNVLGDTLHRPAARMYTMDMLGVLQELNKGAWYHQ